jgi:hypothetical protein
LYSALSTQSKEHSIQPLSEAIALVARAEGLHPATREFIVGLLVAEFSNKSFEYLDTALLLCAELPFALLWFALLAGGSPKNDVLKFADSIGRLIAVHLRSEANLPVTADISFTEFIVANQESRQPFRRFGAGEAACELIDGVSTRVLFRPRSRISTRASNDHDQRMRRELRTLQEATVALNTRLERFASAFDSATEEQLPLAPLFRKRSEERKGQKGVQKRVD